MLSDEIREAVKRSTASVYRIAQEAKVAEWSLYKFVKGEVGLSMRALDRLAAFVGMTVSRPDASDGGDAK